ncbi:hypothetical protein CYMTET_13306 [Cymbomonas tetramitiformis]|uniref:Uncharacterized protein n=1 Tax=Cymbomonas tetramitiformis TaxID=36881 RepID=A0AAE0LB07_9CHLO|nr:hypothetical protein CYMTET_13306 [Cymbomonas tetramitiformis]
MSQAGARHGAVVAEALAAGVTGSRHVAVITEARVADVTGARHRAVVVEALAAADEGARHAPEALQQEPSQKPMLKRMDQDVRAPAAAAAELVQMYEDRSGSSRQLGEDACTFDELEKAEDGMNWFRGFRPIPITWEELEERDNAKLDSMLAKMRPYEGTSTMVDGERSSSDEGDEAFGMSDSEDDEAEDTPAGTIEAGSTRRSMTALRICAIQAALAPPLLWDREEEEEELRLATPPSGNGISRTGTPEARHARRLPAAGYAALHGS